MHESALSRYWRPGPTAFLLTNVCVSPVGSVRWTTMSFYYSEFEDEDDFMEIDSKPCPCPSFYLLVGVWRKNSAMLIMFHWKLRSFRTPIHRASGGSPHHRQDDWHFNPSPVPSRGFRQDMFHARACLASESVEYMLCHDRQVVIRVRQ